MNIELLLKQLKEIREISSIPLVIMGYYNPILCYGFELFLKEISEIGIDGTIIPDLPIEEYLKYKSV